MPDWSDKYPEVQGTIVDTPQGNNWYDKYTDIGPNKGKKQEKGIDWAGLGRDVALSGAIQLATGPATIPSMAAQGAYGFGSDLYDTWREKGIGGISKEDLLHALVKGGISSLGPLGGRLLSPMLPKIAPKPASLTGQAAVNKADRQGIESLSDEVLEQMSKKEGLAPLEKHVPWMSDAPVPIKPPGPKELSPFAERLAKGIAHDMPHMVTGGIFGEMVSPGSVIGPLLGMAGGAAAAHAPQLAKSYINNSFMHSPIQQAIMNQLARSAGEQGADMLKY